MKRMLWISIAASIVVMLLVILLTPTAEVAVAFYGEKIREILFSGLLTVGSFLLTLKVFIVVQFKENVFDSDRYKQRLADRRLINPKISHYGQIRNLSQLLFVSIASSLIAAFLQISIGLFSNRWAMLLCVASAVFAAILLLQVLWLIRKIIREWLEEPSQANPPQANPPAEQKH